MAKPEAAIRVFGAEDAIPRECTGATTRRMRAANSPLQVFAGRWLRLRQIGPQELSAWLRDSPYRSPLEVRPVPAG
jgi:hypothetical protein